MDTNPKEVHLSKSYFNPVVYTEAQEENFDILGFTSLPRENGPVTNLNTWPSETASVLIEGVDDQGRPTWRW